MWASPFLHSSCTSIATTVSNPCEVSNGGCVTLELCLLSAAGLNGYSCVQSTEAAAITALGMTLLLRQIYTFSLKCFT